MFFQISSLALCSQNRLNFFTILVSLQRGLSLFLNFEFVLSFEQFHIFYGYSNNKLSLTVFPLCFAFILVHEALSYID